MKQLNYAFALIILFTVCFMGCRYDTEPCQQDVCDRQNPKRVLVFADTTSTTPHFMLEYQYNAQGKVTQRESFEMPKRILIFRLTSVYNSSGQLTEEQRFGEQGQGSATARPPFVFVGNTIYEYKNGLLATRKSFNLDRKPTEYYTYIHDSQNHLRTTWRFLGNATKPIDGYAYDYDGEGRVILEKGLNPDSTIRYTLKNIYTGSWLTKTQSLDNQGGVSSENDYIRDGLGNLLEVRSKVGAFNRMTYCGCNLIQEIRFDFNWGGIQSVSRYEY